MEQPVSLRHIDPSAGDGGGEHHLLRISELGYHLRVQVTVEDLGWIHPYLAIEASAELDTHLGIGEHQPCATRHAVSGRCGTRYPPRHIPPVPQTTTVVSDGLTGAYSGGGRYAPTVHRWVVPTPGSGDRSGDPVAGVTPGCGGQLGVGFGWVLGGGGVSGVGGVECGVKTHCVVGVAGQGAQRVVVGVAQGVADRKSE